MHTSNDFTWQVRPGGYAWVKHEIPLNFEVMQPQWMLAELMPTRDLAPARTYHPVSDFTGLFLAFAETPPTHGGIMDFVNRFGRLGRPSAMEVGQDELGRPTRPTGEPFESWRQQISDLQQAVQLWQKTQETDMVGLASHIVWQSDGSVVFVSHAGCDDGQITPSGHRAARLPIASKHYHPERLSVCRPGDLIMPALMIVQETVNERLGAMASPQLIHSDQHGRMELALVPRDLLGAIWLQFAMAVAGDKKFRRCGQCNRSFEISPETARTNRQFCSGACRTKSHRVRHERARELHKQGKSTGEIARELESDEATIAKWLAAFDREVPTPSNPVP